MPLYAAESDGQFIERIYSTMKDRRKALGKTQRQVAEGMGHNQTWISIRERGTQALNLLDARRIAAALGMPEQGKAKLVTRLHVSDRPTPPVRPTPAVLPKFRAPVPPQRPPVAPTPTVVKEVEKPKPEPKPPVQWAWNDDLTVNIGGDSVKVPIFNENEEAELELSLKDGRKLRALLTVKLPDRPTETAAIVTRALEEIEKSLRKSVTTNRRAVVMRLLGPHIQDMASLLKSEVDAARSGAHQMAEKAVCEIQRLHRDLEQAKRAGTENVGLEVNDSLARLNSTQNREMAAMDQENTELKRRLRQEEAKLQRARTEMYRLDEVIKELEGRPAAPPSEGICGTAEEHEYWEKRLETAMETLDEVNDLADQFTGTGDKMMGMAGRLLKDALKGYAGA